MNLETIKKLEQLVIHFHKSKEGYNEILSLIANSIYSFPLKNRRCDRDDCGEFYLYFTPSLHRILKRYKPGIRSFYGYLMQILKWRLSTYIKKKNQKKLCQVVETHDSLWDNVNHKHMKFNNWDEQSIKEIFNATEDNPMQKSFDKRLLLASSLKYSTAITEENWKKIIKITESDSLWISKKREEIQELVKNKKLYYYNWIKRCNRCYFKIRFQENLLKLMDNPESIKKLKEKIKRLWESYNRIIKKITAIRLTPSRLEISRLLNIPKGTLDTSFSSLKQRLLKLDQDEEFKYPL